MSSDVSTTAMTLGSRTAIGIDVAAQPAADGHQPHRHRRAFGKDLALLPRNDPVAGGEHFAGGRGPTGFFADERLQAEPRAVDRARRSAINNREQRPAIGPLPRIGAAQMRSMGAGQACMTVE